MPVFDIYSRRRKRPAKTEPEVYQYEHLSPELRQQVCYILETALGPYIIGDYRVNDAWEFVYDTVRREMGVAHFVTSKSNPDNECYNAIKLWQDIDDWFTLVEFCFKCIVHLRNFPNKRDEIRAKQDPDDAIKELNFRFREAGLGYQFENEQIVRVDAQLIHAEVVKPALSLLADPRLKGAQEEFLRAHAHYRVGEHEDAIVDANSAFESTMKAICDIKGWQYSKGARASDLVKLVRREGLLPSYLDSSFDNFIAILKSGLPQIRNEAGGHGQGAAPRETPSYIASYALHLAAANIVLVAEALRASEPSASR